MARGTTLVKLVDDLRAACRMSKNPAHNVVARDVQIEALQRKQEWFWGDFAWPHLRVDRFIDLAAGQRYYDMPEDMDIDRISRIAVRMDSVYQEILPGIYDSNYAAYDSERDQRGWPIQRWQISEGEQIEVWPIPDSNFDAVTLEGRMKITGIRKLNPLVKDTDTADLDDQLLILSCAADYLAATGAKDAQITLDRANRLYTKLRGQLMPRKRFSIGVRPDYRERVRKVPIAVYNKTS